MAQVMLRAGKVVALVIVTLMAIVLGGLAIWVHAELGYPVDEETGPILGPDFIEDDRPVILSEERYEITERRNTNQRVWEIVREVEVLDSLTAEPRVEEVVSNLVQVGDGICYQDSEGQWQVSDARWQTIPGGFVMDQAGYKLSIGKTLGTWLQYEVDGRRMFLMPSQIIACDGIYTETIGTMNEDAAGVPDPNDPACLVFSDAFGPGIDLQLQARPGGYHQDVIFHRKPLLKQPFDPDKTEVMVYTEMNLDMVAESGTVEAQVGQSDKYALTDSAVRSGSAGETDANKAVNAMEPTLSDITFVEKDDAEGPTITRQLHRFGNSEVFDSGEPVVRRNASASKQICRDESGRTYLIERLNHRFFDVATYPVVWDYSTVSGSLTVDTVWYAQNTYYVSGDLTVDDCELRIEPGTFVKFADAKKLTTSNGGTIIARGKPYLNIVFTSDKDTANGEYISSGTVGKGKWGGIKLGKNSEFEFCSVFYSAGVDIEGPLAIPFQHNYLYCNYCSIDVVSTAIGASESLTIFNNLIVPDPCTPDPCDVAIRIDGPTGTTGNIYIRNNTLHLAGNGVYLATSCVHDIVMENNIFSSCWCGIKADTGYAYSRATSNHDGFYNNTSYFTMPYGWSPANATAITTNPFFTDSSYNNYLLNDSEPGGMNFVDTGSDTAANTYGDVYEWSVHNLKDVASSRVFTSSQTISTDTTWSRQTATCDTGTVDLGYHAPRIDYIIEEADVTVNGTTSGAALTIEAGTVIAQKVNATTGAGKVSVDGNDQAADALVCVGEPFGDGYVTWVDLGRVRRYYQYGTVPYANSQKNIVLESGSDYDIRFSELLGLGKAICPFEGGGTILDSMFMLNVWGVNYENCTDYQVRNCLFMGNNMGVRAWDDSTGGDGEVTNCTFDHNWYGISVAGSTGAAVTVKDCLFHTTVRTSSGGHGISYRNTSATLAHTYNSYFNNDYDVYNTVTSQAMSLSTGEVAIEGDPNDPYDLTWTNFSGRYHLNQNGVSVVTGGSITGGMIGYTTALDDTEDSAALDIGYHYPLSDDADDDGLYDYQEYWLGTDRAQVDTDGDGLVDGLGGIVTVVVYPEGLDTDNDGYVDGEADPNTGTDPTDADSDDDGLPDGWEILYELEPLEYWDGAAYLAYYQSGDDPTDTTDDVQAVLFSGSSSQSTIRGLTIRYAGGAAVRTADSASPTVERCIIEDASYGILSANSVPSILNNKITGITNHGIRGMNSVATIKNNLIYDNGLGIAISKNDGDPSKIVNNTIVDNGWGLVRLIATVGTPNVSLANCILYSNDTNIGVLFSPAYCCIGDWTGGGTGNFSSPGFVTETYSLDASSDCIDGGSNQTGQDSENDIDLTQPRIIDGDGDETDTVDVGADEYDPPS